MSYGNSVSGDKEGSTLLSSRIPDNQCPWPLKNPFHEMWMDDWCIVERDWAFQFAHYKAMGKFKVEVYDAATHCVFNYFLSTTTIIIKEHA